MFNPADISKERIAQLAERMKDPQLRAQAAQFLAANVGPAPDQQQEIQRMMQPQQQQQMAPQQPMPAPAPQAPAPAPAPVQAPPQAPIRPPGAQEAYMKYLGG